jgi:bifunctional DNA-binding transcriptional regulator/antitoxin component of YhaV-PrlF toxin-antitoxin module
MSLIVEVSESGTLQLPAEILQAIGSNTRFVVEVQRDRDSVAKQYRLILSPVPPEQPFWATATPEERAERLMQWVQSHQNGANLPDEALRRENIYD